MYRTSRFTATRMGRAGQCMEVSQGVLLQMYQILELNSRSMTLPQFSSEAKLFLVPSLFVFVIYIYFAYLVEISKDVSEKLHSFAVKEF